MANRLSQMLLESLRVDTSGFNLKDVTDADGEYYQVIREVGDALYRFQSSPFPRNWDELEDLGERLNSFSTNRLSKYSILLKTQLLKSLEKELDFYLNFDKRIGEFLFELNNLNSRPRMTRMMVQKANELAKPFLSFVQYEPNVSNEAKRSGRDIANILSALEQKVQ